MTTLYDLKYYQMGLVIVVNQHLWTFENDKPLTLQLRIELIDILDK